MLYCLGEKLMDRVSHEGSWDLGWHTQELRLDRAGEKASVVRAKQREVCGERYSGNKV